MPIGTWITARDMVTLIHELSSLPALGMTIPAFAEPLEKIDRKLSENKGAHYQFTPHFIKITPLNPLNRVGIFVIIAAYRN